MTPTSTGVLDRLKQLRIAPVIVIDDADHAVPLARALAEGGLPCAEITFRTAAAADSLRRITSEVPEIFAGAGTVLTPVQAGIALDAGAKFIVAPGFNAAVVDYCVDRGIPVFPGVCTPTEIDMALQKGLRTVKFFPAEPIGGLPLLKAISAPFGDVQFIPTGGVNLENLASYLSFEKVVACGGSWMAPNEWIAARAFDRVKAETARAVSFVREFTVGGSGFGGVA